MAVTVETLEKLERKITFSLPVATIQKEVDSRLKRVARTAKMDGFRPGKVPMSIVAQQYGYSVQYDVINEKIRDAFDAAVTEAELRVMGAPQVTEKENPPEGELVFDAIFEVYPEVKVADLGTLEIEKLASDVDEAAIDKTIEILRKQHCTFSSRAENEAAQDSDRVTVDFEGKIDGELFEGGQAKGIEFLIGEGQMLKEFENAVRGMKTGESKTFPLNFPADYHGKDVAGKQADFMVTVHKIEAINQPEIDDAFVQKLGIKGATVAELRQDIKANLEREVRFRLMDRNKQIVMNELIAHSELDIPKISVQNDIERLREEGRAELKERGLQNIEKLELPDSLFTARAEKRLRLTFILAELMKKNSDEVKVSADDVKAHIQDLASSYEHPEQVVRWYMSDQERLGEIQSLVLENKVIDFVLSKAKVTEKKLGFEELMTQNQATHRDEENTNSNEENQETAEA